MKKLLMMATISLFIVGAGRATAYDAAGGDKQIIGKKFGEIADLAVTDIGGKTHKLSELRGSNDILVFAFLSHNCPWSTGRRARLQALADMYGTKGVRVIGISSNKPDRLSDVIANAREGGAKFPIYRDENKSLTQALRAKGTPHMFIFDKNGVLRFAGAFDDSMEANKVKQKIAEDALIAVLEGKEVANPYPKFPIGCSIK